MNITIPSELFTSFNDVTFHDEPHKYYVEGKELVSVTTLIHRYQEKFNEDYWLGYKANEYNLTPELILRAWNFINKKGTIKGSAIHDYAENLFQNKIFKYPKELIINEFGFDPVWKEYEITKKHVDKFYCDVQGKLIPIRKNKISYRIAFNNSIDDSETINLIHDRICPEAKIVIPKILYNRRKKQQLCLQWTSEHMANTLKSYNIYPRKTYDKNFKLPENLLTDELWRHFIRGFFDGDGHVGSETVEFVFTSEPFMLQVMSWFSNFNYRVYHIDGKTTDYWKVVIPVNNKAKSTIYHYLYDGASNYLNRKHDNFNTEISYSLKNKTIEIVEHRVEKI